MAKKKNVVKAKPKATKRPTKTKRNMKELHLSPDYSFTKENQKLTRKDLPAWLRGMNK